VPTHTRPVSRKASFKHRQEEESQMPTKHMEKDKTKEVDDE
jgi:hypothetical protein